MDLSTGDFRLQGNSPCINAGHNAYVTSDADLDGLPRIVGGTIDIGAYESQAPGSVIVKTKSPVNCDIPRLFIAVNLILTSIGNDGC